MGKPLDEVFHIVCDVADLEREQSRAAQLTEQGWDVRIDFADADAFARARDAHLSAAPMASPNERDLAEQEEWRIIGEALDYASATGRISTSIAARLNKALQDTMRGRPPRGWVRTKAGQPMPEEVAYAIRAALHYLRLSDEGKIQCDRVKETIAEAFGVPTKRIDKWKKLNLATARSPEWLVELVGSDGPGAVRGHLQQLGETFRRWPGSRSDRR